jgi:hypothetical protein
MEEDMKVRGAIAALSTAALVGGGTLAVGFAAGASATTATHTLKLISVQEKTLPVAKNNVLEQDKDVTHKGKLVGFDVLNFKFNLKTHKGTVLVALDLKGGMLFAVAPVSMSGGKITGTVTGGVGVFKDATGTLVAKNLNKSGTRTGLTITYTT